MTALLTWTGVVLVVPLPNVGFGQVQLLQAELKPSYPSLESNTIDKYQGRDKEVIDCPG